MAKVSARNMNTGRLGNASNVLNSNSGLKPLTARTNEKSNNESQVKKIPETSRNVRFKEASNVSGRQNNFNNDSKRNSLTGKSSSMEDVSPKARMAYKNKMVGKENSGAETALQPMNSSRSNQTTARTLKSKNNTTSDTVKNNENEYGVAVRKNQPEITRLSRSNQPHIKEAAQPTGAKDNRALIVVPADSPQPKQLSNVTSTPVDSPTEGFNDTPAKKLGETGPTYLQHPPPGTNGNFKPSQSRTVNNKQPANYDYHSNGNFIPPLAVNNDYNKNDYDKNGKFKPSRAVKNNFAIEDDSDEDDERADTVDESSFKRLLLIEKQLVDLHVYIVSPDQWREHLQNAVNQIINDAVSAGFIRVHPEGTLGSLREEIENQLGPDAVPQEYIFLRSVGRCLTKVRAKQEYDLKVKHFLPPQGYSEIYVIDASAVQQTPLPTSDSQSRRPANGYHSSDSSWSDASLRKQQQPLPPIKKESHDVLDSTPHPPEASSPHPLQAVSSSSASEYPLNTEASAKLKPVHNFEKSPIQFVVQKDGNRFSSLSSLVDPPPPSNNNTERLSPIKPADNALEPRASSIRPTPSEKEPVMSSKNTSIVPPDMSNNNSTSGAIAKENSYVAPLSATPNSLMLDTNLVGDEMNEQDQQQDQGDYVIPLSATPSHSPDYTARALEEEKRRKLLEEIERKKEQERLEELKRREEEEKRRLEELRKREEKRKREEEERRRREEEERRRLEEEERRRLEEKRKQEDEERRRREDEDRRRREEEARRKRLEEEERQRRDEEERRRRDEERRRLDEEERKRKEDDKRRQEEEERNRLEREAEERKRREEERKKFEEREMKRKQQEQMTNAQKLSNEERKALVEQLMRLKEERRQLEGKREDLARNARQMQTKAQSKRSQARDVWKRRYFDEKKKTPALEDEAERLHEELEMLHKKILSQLETAKEEKTKSKSSDQSGLRFKAMRMQHEIDNLERLVENVKMKLTTEMKLRNQAQMELRALRAELAEKKIGLIQSESQHQNIQGLIQHEDYNSLYVPRI